MGGFISAILILVISFYLVIEKNGVERFVKEAVPNNLQPRVLKIVERIQLKLSRWFIGQLSLGFIVGSMSFVGLHLLGVPYALVLGIIAGILELIPYLGPTLSAIPAIIIAFTVSPILALLTLILYFLIQQFENYLIVPKVMEKSVNLHPVIIIIVILIGGKFAGITGAILAVPTATIISIVLDNFYNKKTKNEG
jgi:predicted PurR-regulated permease PerM